MVLYFSCEYSFFILIIDFGSTGVSEFKCCIHTSCLQICVLSALASCVVSNWLGEKANTMKKRL